MVEITEPGLSLSDTLGLSQLLGGGLLMKSLICSMSDVNLDRDSWGTVSNYDCFAAGFALRPPWYISPRPPFCIMVASRALAKQNK